jgi:cation:H+ antiporter
MAGRNEIPFSLLAILVLGILANDRLIDKSDSSALMRTDGLIFLSFFVIFLYYSGSIAKRMEGMEELVPSKQYGLVRSLLWVILGLIGLTLGGTWIVDGAVQLATRFGMSQSLVGLTIVTIGTSLPELLLFAFMFTGRKRLLDRWEGAVFL